MTSPKRVLSCIQPTGNLHLGRYFGAIQNWVGLQEKYECLYGIVDLHAMTMPYDPKKLTAATWELAFNLVACGLKPENIFIQSLIPEHIELSWIFNCMTGFGELGKMTQFKDKSRQVQEKGSDAQITSGLYTYPVLQAADILIYRADYVPVGKDQEQHLELTRNIAGRFNHRTGKPYFVLPEPLFTEIPKVMSTADPTRKMSASLGEKHNINLFASPEKIVKQIRSAVTDTGDTNGLMSPGVENLFSLLKAAGAEDDHAAFMQHFENGTLRYGDLKQAVSEAIVSMTEPFRDRKAEILADKKAMKAQIRSSTQRIRSLAQETVREVKEMMGLLNVRQA
ncbi:MAG: tryptophan--tRNA ligase [Saprospiraceae bacterium]|nr:tryptophan--tRNA ligase [Saprospiraceae bacterium]